VCSSRQPAAAATCVRVPAPGAPLSVSLSLLIINYCSGTLKIHAARAKVKLRPGPPRNRVICSKGNKTLYLPLVPNTRFFLEAADSWMVAV